MKVLINGIVYDVLPDIDIYITKDNGATLEYVDITSIYESVMLDKFNWTEFRAKTAQKVLAGFVSNNTWMSNMVHQSECHCTTNEEKSKLIADTAANVTLEFVDSLIERLKKDVEKDKSH